ncbi:MAG TPA: tetratricopeptide repeat protein [Roseiflexaceae bacterium]|nr:tetratricopeptide repeat protein [Roseiflexaceae bacterium]
MVATAPQDNLIVATFRGLLADAGPRQAEVMRACAVPRWFDTAVLELLRGRADGNERVLELLRGYSFVRPLSGGRYTYQEEVRAALLEEWRALHPAELRTLNERLAAHFASRAGAMEQERGPDASVGVRPGGGRALLQREALYHQLMLDQRAGMDQLRAEFDQAEASLRLADCEALLQTAQEAPIEASGRMWLRYMRARLDRLALRLSAAAEELQAILAAPNLEPALAASASQTLGEVLAETGQWVGATALYHRSLQFFEQSGDRSRAAEVLLLLGEAYEGLGDDSGGWHVPAYARNPLGHLLGRVWSWLQSLPFVLMVIVLRMAGIAIPQARYLGPYQNWPLIWLYRTADGWYRRAQAAFEQLGEENGAARAELRRAEIERLFGYSADALARLDRLRAMPAANTPYRRAWVDRGRAAALLDRGEIDAALALLGPALALFRELGDPRGEAAVLALQGRAAAAAGRVDDALASYRGSLARFRTLGYAEAREQALHNLRAWRRQVGPGETSRRIGALLAEEPEKRYVARFPSSKVTLLQVLSLAALPLSLLLSAISSPRQVFERLAGSQPLLAQTYYDPLLGVSSLLFLLALYVVAYALVALVVIFFVPLNNLEREQPDYVITSPSEIVRYDRTGAPAQRLRWDAIRRWLRFDQQLWRRPLPLFSGTLLAGDAQRNLQIEAITGWYTSLQEDIGQRLGAAGNPTTSEARGLRILNSASGALLAIGIGLLLLTIAGQNRWVEWLYRLSPSIYAALALLGFSGGLILIPLAYWLANRPLAWEREFRLNYRWAIFVGAVGLVAVLLFVVGGGNALPVPALNVGLLIWGAYLLAEALGTLFLPRPPAARLALIGGTLLVVLALVAPLTTALYYRQLGRVYMYNQNYAAARLAYRQSLRYLPASQRSAAADSWNNIGIALYQAGRFAEAAKAYTEAANLLLQQPASAERDRYIAALLFNRSWALRQANDRAWIEDLRNTCALTNEFCQSP